MDAVTGGLVVRDLNHKEKKAIEKIEDTDERIAGDQAADAESAVTLSGAVTGPLVEWSESLFGSARI